MQFSPKNYIAQPLLKWGDPKFQLSPGNRGDFLVKAPNLPGTKLLIPFEVIGAIEKQGQVSATDKGTLKGRVRAQTRAALDLLAPGDRQPALLAVYICKPGGDKVEDKNCEEKSMTFPETLPPLPPFLKPITPNRPPRNVQFQILDVGDPPVIPASEGRFGIQMRVNEKLEFVQFDPRCANFTVPIDPRGGEEWHLSQNINADEGAPPFHVFHIHTNPFQVVGTETRQTDGTYRINEYPEPIWQDSITLPDNETGPTNNAGGNADEAGVRVVIRQRFEDYTGAFVLHCHFLGHEDRGMMLMVQAVCPDSPGFFSTTRSFPQCVNNDSLIPALPPCPMPVGSEGHAGH